MNKLRTTIILSLILAIFVTVAVACNQPIEEGVEQLQAESEAETTYEVVPFITIHEDAKAETEELIFETESSTESETKTNYNVPLPQYLQDVIIAECALYDIDPAIVIALIEKESTFDQYAMGDDGRAFGLMQIQPKWHLQKMIELGCTNLFDPVQNVMVGTAILGELKLRYNDIGSALTAYNSGSGGLNAYAKAILARANEL